MENNTEVLEPQNTPSEETPKVEEITIPKEELDDLKHRAEVSSQNYERAKKAELKVKELEESVNNNVPLEMEPDEGDDIAKIKTELSDVKSKLAKSEVIESFPQLKEAWSEFDEFRSQPDNKGMNLKTAAKAFLIEKGLLEPQRKGLEKTTGGPKVPPSTGMSPEELKRLRETNFRQYREMIKKGQIKI